MNRRPRDEKAVEIFEFKPESKFQAYCISRLKQLPNIHVMNISDKFNSGYSDLFLCIEGKFVAIELKVGKNKPTKLQLEFIEHIKEAGGYGGVAWYWYQVKEIIRNCGYPIDRYIS